MAKAPDAFRTISEVADWLETPAHVLRFWESKFTQVKPVKRAGGRRYYRRSDMELLGGIKKLLHDDGMTIKNVQKVLREEGVKHVAALCARPLDGDEVVETAADSNVIPLTPSAEAAAPEPTAPEAAEQAADPAAADTGQSGAAEDVAANGAGPAGADRDPDPAPMRGVEVEEASDLDGDDDGDSDDGAAREAPPLAASSAPGFLQRPLFDTAREPAGEPAESSGSEDVAATGPEGAGEPAPAPSDPAPMPGEPPAAEPPAAETGEVPAFLRSRAAPVSSSTEAPPADPAPARAPAGPLGADIPADPGDESVAVPASALASLSRADRAVLAARAGELAPIATELRNLQARLSGA